MPNIYISPAELKDSVPDFIPPGVDKYDSALIRFCNEVSRFVDHWCARRFYPVTEDRYFDRTGRTSSWIDDVLSISALEYSEDDGATYTALSESGNWLLSRAGQHNHPGSYDQVVIDPNGTTQSVWPSDLKALKLTGIWAYADDRTDCWESSGDTVQDAPLSDSATTLTVSDDAGRTAFGMKPRFAAGMLIRIETEFLEITNVQDKELTVLRGRNGSTAASHVNDTAIDIWRAPDPIRQAVLIQAVRAHMRATQGFADSRANAEIGELFFLKKMDPEAQELLAPYRLKRILA
jgi:hypothetical protein